MTLLLFLIASTLQCNHLYAYLKKGVRKVVFCCEEKFLLLDRVIVCLDQRNYCVQYLLFRKTAALHLQGLPAPFSSIKTIFIPCLPKSFDDVLFTNAVQSSTTSLSDSVLSSHMFLSMTRNPRHHWGSFISLLVSLF